MKKLNFAIKFIYTLVFCIGIVFTKNLVFGAEYKIESYDINATINKNGNVHVEEYLKYYFDENMNGVYREIMYRYNFSNQKNDINATSSRYQADSIQNIDVYTSDNSFNDMQIAKVKQENTLSNGMSGVYSIQDFVKDGYRTKIKVYTPVKGEHFKYIKYVYDIVGATVKYNDAGEIYWNFLGKDWECSIYNLKVNINFDTNVNMSNVKVYPHSYANMSNVILNSDKLSFNVKDISEGTSVDARLVFPVEALVDKNVNINENYDYLNLEKIENQMIKNKENYNLSNKIYILIAVISFFGFIYIIIKSSKNASKNLPKNKNIEYYRDPLDNLSLGEYSVILSKFIGYTNSNLLIATILDLSNKKYIKMECLKKANKKVFDNVEYDYYLTIDKNKDVNKLNEYEKLVINYLFNEESDKLDDLQSIKEDKIELNEKFKKLSTKYTLISKFQKKCSEFNKKASERMYYKSSGGIYKLILIFITSIIISVLYTTFVVSPLNNDSKMLITFISIMISSFLGIMLCCIAYSCSFILKDEYVQEYKMLMGLKKYLNEYSLIKDRYPIEIALWDRYLVFASLFGIAQKVAKEFKEELIKNGYDDNYIFTNYAILNMSMHSDAITTSAMGSTGSSGSGGYSGGGGGGRRRRRRRSLLKL